MTPPTPAGKTLNEELVEALKLSANLLEQYQEESGECDHSVNICVCDVIQARKQVLDAIAKAEAAQ